MSNVTFGRRGRAPVSAHPLISGARPSSSSAAAVQIIGKPPSWAQVTAQRNGVMMLVCVAFMAALAYFYGPGLLRDMRHASSFRADFSLRVVTGDCTNYLFILKTCNVRFKEADGAETTARFLLMFSTTEGQRILPMRAPADRDAISVGFAIDNIRNRLLSFAGLTLLLIASFTVGALRLMQGRYKNGPADMVWNRSAPAG